MYRKFFHHCLSIIKAPCVFFLAALSIVDVEAYFVKIHKQKPVVLLKFETE